MQRLAIAAFLACACAHAPPPAPVAAVPPAPVEPAPAEHRQLAEKAIARGDWETARRHLEAFLAKEPGDAGGWFEAGWVAERRGDLSAARAAYAKVLELQPAHTAALLDLVRLLPPDEAEKALRTALQAKQEPKLLDALAEAQRRQKKLDAAEGTVRRVLERHPRDADAWRTLAAIEADRGRIRLAESALRSARKLDEKDAGISNSLGLLAIRGDDPAAARAHFEEAVQLDPRFAAAWTNLGALALRYRDYPAAEASYAKALALDGGRWETHLAHGWALEGLKRPKDARAEFEQVLAMRPGQEEALYGRAAALRAEGDLPGAMQAFKEYAASGKAHLKEAQAQMAQIDLRLKNPPARPKPPPKPAGDLSKLPQGTDAAPAGELPAEEGPVPAPEGPPVDKPAAGADAGVQNATPEAAKTVAR